MKGRKYSKEQAIKLVSDCYDVDEPVFIIRAKDSISWKAVKAYSEILKNSTGAKNHGLPSYNLAEEAERFAGEILAWQGLNMEKIKLPD